MSIVKILCKITDAKEMKSFLEELLTAKERDDLELRWELMRRLKDGETQRKISKDLHISLCKVTRGNKIIKNSSSITNRLLNREER